MEFFLVRIFPYLEWIRSKYAKIRTRTNSLFRLSLRFLNLISYKITEFEYLLNKNNHELLSMRNKLPKMKFVIEICKWKFFCKSKCWNNWQYSRTGWLEISGTSQASVQDTQFQKYVGHVLQGICCCSFKYYWILPQLKREGKQKVNKGK